MLKIIYTTNFDVLIEKALESEGLSAGSDFKVYSSETDFALIRWDDAVINIVKIHGVQQKKRIWQSKCRLLRVTNILL
ncbi:MAG: SIR2 family protein [Mucilaginibacter sp.]|nr:SIR2 family protein [Mucilaginibacter sp.]